MKVPEKLLGTLVSTPDTLNGAMRFIGTRVPVQALWDTLSLGHTIDYFLEGFPGVTRDQVEAVLKYAQGD